MHRGGRGDARASCASPLGTPLGLTHGPLYLSRHQTLNVGFSYKLTSKGTWRLVFICLRPPFPSPPPPRYTLYDYIPLYLFTYSRKWGGGVGEPVRRLEGASSQDGSKIPTWMPMSPARRILRSSRPQEIFQPPREGFFSVHALLQLLGNIFQLSVLCTAVNVQNKN